MIIEMHPSVQKVAEFMQKNLPSNELVEVANALYFLAQPLWGPLQHQLNSVYPIKMVEPVVEDTPPITYRKLP